uniref:Uncharacterized protein n=1 Tax=Panagrolaimus davidi TaxID=227884 RepID=A0A914PQ84_9BILA
MKERILEGIIILQIWQKGAITLLSDTLGQMISHVRNYGFDMEDEESYESLLEKVSDICKNEHREFKGVLMQLFFDQKDAKFPITFKFCNYCKEFFNENNIFFHITTVPILTAYTAIINSQILVPTGERIMVVTNGEHYFMGELKNYCIQILARTDSNSYQIVHTSLASDEIALPSTNEMIKQKYKPKKVILLQLFPKSSRPSTISTSASTASETNYFLAAKKLFKSFHPICIPQSFATLSMEAGAKMLMALLVALDNTDDKAYVLAKVNPSDFKCQKVRATLKIDINSIYEFYVEPANDMDEETKCFDEDYSHEEEEFYESSDDDNEDDDDCTVSTCIELSGKEDIIFGEGNNGMKNVQEEGSISDYEDNIEDGFDNSTIEWNNSDDDDSMNAFEVGSITSIESFMENDPGYKIRVIFDKQYFWIYAEDSREYEKIPIFIAFNETKPIVGDAAKRLHETQPSFVVYDLIEICSNLKELKTDQNWPFTLKNDSDGIFSFFFESINGSTKSTPDFLLAIILKHCLKLIKQKTGEKINELFICFNFPNPTTELKNIFMEAAKLLPLKPKIVFC